jgi:hypothetical protein
MSWQWHPTGESRLSPGTGTTPRQPERGAFQAAGKIRRCAREAGPAETSKLCKQPQCYGHLDRAQTQRSRLGCSVSLCQEHHYPFHLPQELIYEIRSQPHEYRLRMLHEKGLGALRACAYRTLRAHPLRSVPTAHFRQSVEVLTLQIPACRSPCSSQDPSHQNQCGRTS